MGCPANGSRHSMALVAESVAGTTPATPVFTPIRQTGTTLALTKETIQSQELRADRQIADMRHGNKQVVARRKDERQRRRRRHDWRQLGVSPSIHLRHKLEF